jgi:hypothetical protein
MIRFRTLIERWGWLDLVIGGVIWAVFHIWYLQFGNINNPTEIIPVIWIMGVGTIFLLLGCLALFLSTTNSGVKGGLGITMIGMGLLSLGTIMASFLTSSAFLLVILGEMITTLGLLIFAIANFGERIIGILFWLPLLMTPIYFISWSVDPGASNIQLDNWTEWLAALYGLGWVLAGLGFYTQIKKSDEPKFIPTS